MARSVIVSAVRTPFGKFGGALKDYEAPFDEYALLQPAGVVPAITFRTDDAEAFLDQYLSKFLEELGDPRRYEGFYFRIESLDGEPLWEWAGSSRLGAERTEAQA